MPCRSRKRIRAKRRRRSTSTLALRTILAKLELAHLTETSDDPTNKRSNMAPRLWKKKQHINTQHLCKYEIFEGGGGARATNRFFYLQKYLVLRWMFVAKLLIVCLLFQLPS